MRNTDYYGKSGLTRKDLSTGVRNQKSERELPSGKDDLVYSSVYDPKLTSLKPPVHISVGGNKKKDTYSLRNYNSIDMDNLNFVRQKDESVNQRLEYAKSNYSKLKQRYHKDQRSTKPIHLNANNAFKGKQG